LLSKTISNRDKSAIRTDWQQNRKSAYNYQLQASCEYRKLLNTINAHFILTSYSTDGMIALDELIQTNLELGDVSIELKGYKRYGTSSQRKSNKPLNVEFIIITDTSKSAQASVEDIKNRVLSLERSILSAWYKSKNKKHRGATGVVETLSIQERQTIGATYTNQLRKENTERAIRKAVKVLAAKGSKIGATAIAREAGINRRTAINHCYLWADQS